jgi:hypothetical protein
MKNTLRMIALSLVSGAVMATALEGQSLHGKLHLGVTMIIDFLSYASSMAFFQMGLLSWKSHKKDFTKVRLSVPMVYWTSALLLAVFPLLITTATETGIRTRVIGNDQIQTIVRISQ